MVTFEIIQFAIGGIIYFNANRIVKSIIFQFLTSFFWFSIQILLKIGIIYWSCLNRLSLITNSLFSSILYFNYFDYFWQIYLHLLALYLPFSFPIFILLSYFKYVPILNTMKSTHLKFLVLCCNCSNKANLDPILLIIDFLIKK